MKTTLLVFAALALAALTACQNAAPVNVSGGQLIGVDQHTRLLVSVEGVKTRPTPVESAGVPNPGAGEPIHRVLESSDGKVLFAYDLQIGKSGADGAYRILLKPAKKTPTFAASREVTVKSHEDVVRVELMEQPETGQKIVDVFRLLDREGGDSGESPSVSQHLRQVHNFLFHMFHGK